MRPIFSIPSTILRYTRLKNALRSLSVGVILLVMIPLSVSPLHAKESVILEFYDILSAPDTNKDSSPITFQLSKVVAELWETTPPLITTLPKATPRTALIKQIQDYHKIIPDLKWEPIEIIKGSNQTYTVISKLSGTPYDTFLGIVPTGNKFEILTIEVHILEKNRIKTSYRVEDWLNAAYQLSFGK